jgi:hypothetical protein
MRVELYPPSGQGVHAGPRLPAGSVPDSPSRTASKDVKAAGRPAADVQKALTLLVHMRWRRHLVVLPSRGVQPTSKDRTVIPISPEAGFRPSLSLEA